jgi:hypothetical protein
VLITRAGDRADYGNLKHCGTVNLCPCCHVTRRTRRAREIKYAALKWEAEGYGLLQVTITFPHRAGMPLAALWPFVSDGLGKIRRGRPWRDLKAAHGITHDIRALEVTHGYNGWHPHVHLLLFVTSEPGVPLARAIAPVRAYFAREWARWVREHGYGEVHPVHGVDVRAAEAAAADYVGKVQSGHWHIGRELAAPHSKAAAPAHRTFFEITADAREHRRPADVALVREWAECSAGRQMITMSKGLRDWAGLDDLTDAALAARVGEADDDARERAGLVPAAAWRVVTADDHLYEGLLSACGVAGLRGVNDLLALHGLPLAIRPPPGWRPKPIPEE